MTEDSPPHSSDLNVQDLDNLFDLHKRIGNLEEDVEVIHIGQFLKSLETTGIRRSDRRLKEMIANLQALGKEIYPDVPIESLTLDRMQFKRSAKKIEKNSDTTNLL